MKRLLYLLIILLAPFNVFAATGTVKASASSTNVTLNNTVTVTVKVSSTGKLGSWQYGLSYDKSKLSLISGDQSIVGYGDGSIQTSEQGLVWLRNEHSLMVVVCLVVVLPATLVNEKDSKTVSNGNTRRYKKEVVGKTCILMISLLVKVVVQNQHCHYDCLSGTGGHLECSSRQPVIRVVAYSLNS